MSDLAKRWAVAVVGIPAVLVLLYFGGWPLAVPVAVLAALGAMECYRMASHSGVEPLQGVGAVGSAVLVLGASWRPTFADFAPVALAVLVAVTAVTLVAALKVRGPQRAPLQAVAVTVFGILYAGLPMAFIPLLHAAADARGWATASVPWGGGIVVALPLAATWLGDAVAFFAGTAWGRGGLAPTISPNKSWVGVWGGLTGAGVAGAIWFLIADARLPELPVPGPLIALLVGVLLGIGAIVGDLAESLMKRGAGVKDSGALFPGHGGVLDRLDALLFTLPLAYGALVALEALS